MKTEDDAKRFLSISSSSSTASTTSSSKIRIYGAKIKGSLVDYINIMLKSKVNLKVPKDADRASCSKPVFTAKNGEDLIVLSSFDGAESFRSSKNVDSVVTFSSQIFTSKAIQERAVYAGSSMNILTWFQYLGKEDWNSMSPILNSYFIERKRLETGVDKPIGFEESKVWLYDMHDAKLWYELFAHSLWSRKHHRFLLCACTSYARVCDNSSENCHFINDLDFAQKYEFSKERWEDRMARGVQYSKDSHKNWCDEHNFGITHFAVKPQSMPPSHVRFDMFHMKCAVTRNLMNYIRFLVQKQGKPLRDSFTENVLRGIFHRFHIFCWNNNFAFSIMKGNDLGRFVLNLPTVTAFLRSNLIPTDEMTALVGALDLVGDNSPS